MMLRSYLVGQIVAPQFLISSEAPRYPTGLRAFYVSAALVIVIKFLSMEIHGFLEDVDESRGLDIERIPIPAERPEKRKSHRM
jgi:hypothetical protein